MMPQGRKWVRAQMKQVDLELIIVESRLLGFII